MEEGVEQGKRPELTGGGMIRSLGGWAVVKGLGKDQELRKGDERILGDSDFVEETLRQAAEAWQGGAPLAGEGGRVTACAVGGGRTAGGGGGRNKQAWKRTATGPSPQPALLLGRTRAWHDHEHLSRQLGLSIPAIAQTLNVKNVGALHGALADRGRWLDPGRVVSS